jgi:hypothetical protein
VALLGRALRSGDIPEARRLQKELQTRERHDEARGLLVQHLSNRAEFSDAAAELDAIVDRAVRASVAADALRQTPAWAGKPDAGLSLLLALDGDPDTLAEVLSSMIHQAPDSELVRNLAAAFAPKDGVEVAEALDSLLGGRVTHWISTKPMSKLRSKTLMEIRERARTEPSIANEALIHGTVTLLLSAGVLEDAERTELTDALVHQTA